MSVEVAVLGSNDSLIVIMVSVDVKQHLKRPQDYQRRLDTNTHMCVSIVHARTHFANSKHRFTTSFLEDGAGRRCSECGVFVHHGTGPRHGSVSTPLSHRPVLPFTTLSVGARSSLRPLRVC